MPAIVLPGLAGVANPASLLARLVGCCGAADA
jgi:hypothetical protein